MVTPSSFCKKLSICVLPRELVQEHRIAPGSIDLEGGVHDIDLTEAPSEASDVMLFLCRISPTSPTSIKIKDISDIMEITWFSYLAVICYSWKEIQMLKNDFSGDELAKRLVKPFWVTGTTDHEQWGIHALWFRPSITRIYEYQHLGVKQQHLRGQFPLNWGLNEKIMVYRGLFSITTFDNTGGTDFNNFVASPWVPVASIFSPWRLLCHDPCMLMLWSLCMG